MFATPGILFGLQNQLIGTAVAETTTISSLAVAKVTAIGYEKNTSNVPTNVIDNNLGPRWSNYG